MTRVRTRHALMISAVLIYALFFVILSIDIMVRVWDARVLFDTPLDVLALLYFEGMRSVVTLAAVVLAAVAAVRARRHAALLYLAYAVAFGAIVYTQLAAFRAFPGRLQERLAEALLSAGTPRWLLELLFVHWQWAAWLMLGTLVLMAACYPTRLTAEAVAGSGALDRTGSLRTVPLAGADVGALSRAGVAALVRRGWLHGRRGWLPWIALALLHTAGLLLLPERARSVLNVVAFALALLAAAALVALFRTGWRAADTDERGFLLWLRRGALAGAALFAAAAVSGLVSPGGVLTVVTLSLAPVALIACVARAVFVVPPEPRQEVGLPPNTFRISPVM